MKLSSRIAALAATCVISLHAGAQENADIGKDAWLDGYTAGRALTGLYEDGDREAFIRGVLAAMDESGDAFIDADEVRERKLAWYTDDDLSRRVQASYTAGYLSGDAYQQPESIYSTQFFLQGFLDSLQKGEPRYVDKDKGARLLSGYQRAQFYRMKRDVAGDIQANQRAGAAFLDNNALQPGVVETESGLQYKVLVPGSGASPAANDTVIVSLVGRKIDGEVFYDSTERELGSVSIRVDQALDGWQEALVQMSVGSVWELYLPSSLAYSNSGWQGIVDPGEALIYNLKLIEVIKAE